MSAAIEQRNQDATAYVGNLDEKVTEELLWELMLQAGPVVNVHMPRDKVSNLHQGYGFVEFRTEEDAEYAIKIMNMIQLYGKHLRCNKASQDKKMLDIGANLFIGNLDHEVDEKLLYDTFSAFGGIVQTPKIMRDVETGGSKGFGFIGFDSFEAADLAIECMNGQFLCNRAIVVQYAFKKDSTGERHGSQAERLLAQSNSNSKMKPHTRFAAVPNPPPVAGRGRMPPQAPVGVPPPHPMHMNANMGMMHGQQSMGGVMPPPPPPPQSMMGAPAMHRPGMAGGAVPPPPPPPQYRQQ